MGIKQFTAIFLLLFITGCASQSAIRQPVNDSVNLSQARETEPTGVEVRWGGFIVEVKNESNQSIIEIVERPLTRFGVPKITNSSKGRFLAVSDEFLEPKDFTAGRYITIVGTVDGYQAGKIGDYDYNYPVVKISDYKTWANKSQRSYYPYPYYGHYGFHHPYYFGRYRRHYW